MFKPVTIHNVPQSRRFGDESAGSLAQPTTQTLYPNRGHIADHPTVSLMLVTALDPRIGYDRPVKIGKVAFAENITLKQAAEKLGYVRPEDFDRWVVPGIMTRPGATLPGGGD